MKLTSQEEYGLRCALQMAREPDGILSIPEIAEREGLTRAYVAKLMRLLRRGGIVKSARGNQGGYQLTASPKALSIAAVLAPLGGRLFSHEFCGAHTGRRRVCAHDTDCSLRALLVSVDRLVNEALGRTMLQDLTCSERAMTVWTHAHLEADRVRSTSGTPASTQGQ